MDKSFIREVSKRSGQNFLGCAYCLSCSGGCPFIEDMDYNPNQIIRLMLLGMRPNVLESKAIWLCIGCYNCLDQCPYRINIPKMMDTLREMALEAGVKIPEPEILTFHRSCLNAIKRHGRVHELGMMMRYKLATGKLFQDFWKGVALMCRGRFRLTPSRVDNIKTIRLIMES